MKDEKWNRTATKILKAELVLAEVSYSELVRRLAMLGITESYKGVANKINRGTFTFMFFIQCMKALDKSTVRIDND